MTSRNGAPTYRISKLVRESMAAAFWIIVLLNLFVFNVDRYLLAIEFLIIPAVLVVSYRPTDF